MESEFDRKECSVKTSSPPREDNETALHAWAQRVAPEMFWLSVFSLLSLAGLLHLHDKPEFQPIFIGCGLSLLAVYPICWIDACWGGRLGSRQGRARWLYCALPPLRLGARDHATGLNVWLPGLGWQQVGRADDRVRVDGFAADRRRLLLGESPGF